MIRELVSYVHFLFSSSSVKMGGQLDQLLSNGFSENPLKFKLYFVFFPFLNLLLKREREIKEKLIIFKLSFWFLVLSVELQDDLTTKTFMSMSIFKIIMIPRTLILSTTITPKTLETVSKLLYNQQ